MAEIDSLECVVTENILKRGRSEGWVPTLSKSKYLDGLKCQKLLWYQYNAPKEIPAPDEAQQAIFDAGHEVGKLAHACYPGGVEVDFSKGFASTLEQTRQLLKERRPIYEASVGAKDIYVRVDILVPAEDGTWDIVEVKSGTDVKDVYIDDVALQRFCLGAAGIKVRKTQVLYVNNKYVKRGPIDPQQFFAIEDVTTRVAEALPFIEENVSNMKHIILGVKPEVAIGPQCTAPYVCPMKGVCWAFLEPDNVTELYYAGKRVFSWLDTYPRIIDVPAALLSEKQRIQRDAILTGKLQAQPALIKKWLGTLSYPLHFLDFETINPALPLFDGARPYQHLPFQFSLDILEKDGTSRHEEFLWTEASDPRPALAVALRAIGSAGSVVAYNAPFEQRVLRDLAEEFPNERTHLANVGDRLADLQIPFKNFWYYHPLQHGSCSIKAALPDLYRNLEIPDGGAAQREYFAVVFGPKANDPGERERVFAALRKYCPQDTLALRQGLALLQQTTNAH